MVRLEYLPQRRALHRQTSDQREYCRRQKPHSCANWQGWRISGKPAPALAIQPLFLLSSHHLKRLLLCRSWAKLWARQDVPSLEPEKNRSVEAMRLDREIWAAQPMPIVA